MDVFLKALLLATALAALLGPPVLWLVLRPARRDLSQPPIP